MAEDSAMPPRTAPMGPHEWVPVPDPTVLTTQALYREVSSLRELIELRIEDLSGLLDEKFLRTEQQFELVERQRVEQKNDTKNAVDAALTAQKEAAKEQTVASDRAIAKYLLDLPARQRSEHDLTPFLRRSPLPPVARGRR